MTGDEYAAALRPRRKYGPTLMTCAVCAAVAWLGWCVVEVARANRDMRIGSVCAAAGASWFDGECHVPPGAVRDDDEDLPGVPTPPAVPYYDPGAS